MTLVDSNEIHKYDSTEIIFSNFNYSILKYQRISYDREALDIQKYIFDSIQNDSNVIQDIGGFIDSLISKGYKLEYQNPFLDLVSPTTIIDTFKYAPEFILSDYKKNIFDLSKSKSKLLLIDFGASWCSSCNTRRAGRRALTFLLRVSATDLERLSHQPWPMRCRNSECLPPLLRCRPHNCGRS